MSLSKTWTANVREGYTSIRNYIKGLTGEQRRLVARARFRHKHMMSTYGWKALRYKDLLWLRKGGTSTARSLKRKYGIRR